MPKTARRMADVQKKFQEQGGSHSKRHWRMKEIRNGQNFWETLAAVCKYHCQGHSAVEITDLMQKNHGIPMTREEPYQIISFAAHHGWIRFVPPYELGLREGLKKQYHWLEDVQCVHTSVFDDVGYRGAEMLLELLQKRHRSPYSKKEVHIGFAGGNSMRKLAQIFMYMLRQPIEGLPEKAVFHAMGAGFDVFDPTTDPNAFFTYFVKDHSMQIDTDFVGLHSPAFVKNEGFKELKAMDGIREAYTEVDKLDIIVTSGSVWSDEHNLLRKYMSKSRRALSALKNAGCVGDMLWRPVGKNGPIEIETEIRAMTLLELSDLPRFISEKRVNVLLVIGPCGGCNEPKSEVLDVILNCNPRLITHLVVDSRTARGVLKPQQ